MRDLGRTTLLLGLGTLLSVTTLNGGERLGLRVSPTVALAPGFLTVSVTVEANADNRSLEIITESDAYYRSSQVPLDGQNAPRLNVFKFRQLPTGVYQVTGILSGVNGQRALTQRVATVYPAAGAR
jgi:hypothetical protein